MKWFTRLYRKRGASPTNCIAQSSGSINSVTFDLNICGKTYSDADEPVRTPLDSGPSQGASHFHPLKSILRKESKYDRVEERRTRTKKIRESGGLASLINRRIWESKGYLWPENIDNIPITQKVYMLKIWEVIVSDLQDESDIDLDSYEIVDHPPSVVDLTLYDVETDEDGVFAGGDQPYVEDRLNSTGDLFETNWILGYTVDRTLNEETFGVVESAQQPTYCSVAGPAGLNTIGEIDDSDDIEQYHLEKLLSIQNSISASKNHFEKGRLVVPVVFHRSEGQPYVGDLLVKKNLTAKDIEQGFGLSEDGNILINLDHIVVHQGYCGFNRGKASRTFRRIPKGRDPLKPTVMERFRLWFRERIGERLNKKLQKFKDLFRGT